MIWYFHHWAVDGETYTSNPLTLRIDGDCTITAYYSETPPGPRMGIIAPVIVVAASVVASVVWAWKSRR